MIDTTAHADRAVSTRSECSSSGAAFFESVDGVFVPRAHARSPWSEDLVHGRLVSGLMAHEVERRHLGADLHPARMTTDLFRPIPMSPLTVDTVVRREGKRLIVVEVTVSSGDVPVALATVQILRSGPPGPDVVWVPEYYTAPSPEVVGPPTRVAPRHFGEVRRVDESVDGRRFSWFRETCELLEGRRDTPFGTLAAAADWVSPFTNMGADRLAYINADVTLYCSRLPVGPWIGFENLDHVQSGGVAVSVCALHDTVGRIGTAASAALPY
ncbi:acyl-CoA thioesterase domain-containing protein [Rhodococcus sp. 06-1460-1B]|uniref:acyl-CoA thioesterase domain-containing protein n=1 Tax=Rhodococcus sp. 06-1460-1B TaxID=2022501 RepID=UPI000B9BD4E2|nr:acyl-CoA thioesterase domain-containing protein [Rhodococcus sp. 06-1460-1B]OZD61852.1 hypothetical protein CH268_10765 [Rhodococcus sp. 06-1460-1B]